jgi:hypothetical protein
MPQYIRKIKRCLKNIASIDVRVFHTDVMKFCNSKLKTRFEKLKRDITANLHNDYVSKFVKFALIDVENIDSESTYNFSKLLQVLSINQNKIKYPKKSGILLWVFERYCNNEDYKKLFSNVRLRRLDPIVGNNYIFSWSKIIKQFVPDPREYKDFKETCLKDSFN